MPLLDASDPTAKRIHDEIRDIATLHGGRKDALLYHGGTVATLGLTGAATVLVTALHQPVAAGICSAIATFVIGAEQTLDFGGRWRWHLRRRSAYNRLAYRLNAVALLERSKRNDAYQAILWELERQAEYEAFLPGSGRSPDNEKDRSSGDANGPDEDASGAGQPER